MIEESAHSAPSKTRTPGQLPGPRYWDQEVFISFGEYTKTDWRVARYQLRTLIVSDRTLQARHCTERQIHQQARISIASSPAEHPTLSFSGSYPKVSYIPSPRMEPWGRASLAADVLPDLRRVPDLDAGEKTLESLPLPVAQLNSGSPADTPYLPYTAKRFCVILISIGARPEAQVKKVYSMNKFNVSQAEGRLDMSICRLPSRLCQTN